MQRWVDEDDDPRGSMTVAACVTCAMGLFIGIGLALLVASFWPRSHEEIVVEEPVAVETLAEYEERIKDDRVWIKEDGHD